MNRIILFAAGVMCFSSLICRAQGDPIALHPDNPHYFKYKNSATILITSGEHYGSVLNTEFDFQKYHRALKKNGLNLTRLFTGAYLEPQGAFGITSNNLAPDTAHFICPWSRADQGDSVKFDLSKWDEAYMKRIKAVAESANREDIIIELALFCPFYDDSQWKISPMNVVNNINNVGAVNKDDVYTLDKNGGLLSYQESMVRKLVTELNGFDNIIFEICNEPYFGGVTLEWQRHIASIIKATEKSLPFKHLISQNIANDSAVIKNPDPSVSVFNFHYATPPHAIRQNYELNKVIGDNETGFKGQADSTYRKEGWQIIMAGGGLYNNLDYSFTVGHEDGTFQYPETTPGGGTADLRKQLGSLAAFISRLHFINMKPDRTSITGGLNGARAYMLSDPGKEYAAYFLHGKALALSIRLPKGKYTVEWFDPKSGEYVKSMKLNHNGGVAKITSPEYAWDIALKISK
ncbi:MAG: cellulase family glycosylhydrolase [Chryseolinea sp.]